MFTGRVGRELVIIPYHGILWEIIPASDVARYVSSKTAIVLLSEIYDLFSIVGSPN